MEFANLHPYVYNASRYTFLKGQKSTNRICYASSLYLISEGKGIVRYRGRNQIVVPGSLVYIPAGLSHDWYADKDDPMVHLCCYFDWTLVDRQVAFLTPNMICFDMAQLQPSLIGPVFPYSIPEYMKVDKLRIWIDLFEKFFTDNQYTNERTYYRRLKTQSHFQMFIEFFLAFALKEEYVPDPRILKLLERLDRDLITCNLQPLDSYFREFRMSRGYFFKLFRQATALTPTQYINQFKISRAKDDLHFSDLSVTEIAQKYSFSSVHYFSKMFRQLTGSSPREFREEFRR